MHNMFHVCMYLDVCMSRNQEINLNIARMSFLLIFVYKYFICYYIYDYYLYRIIQASDRFLGIFDS